MSEKGAALRQVCPYLHLNPVPAELVAAEHLRTYGTSSYWHLWRKKQPAFLRGEAALAAGLAACGKSPAAVATERKSAAWTVALAGTLKPTKSAENRWLAEHLQMGMPVR